MSRKDVRRDWEERQREHGNQPRAVLMKGIHPLINEGIDLWHRDVIRAVFSAMDAPEEGAFILDVGCGFGRLANEISRLGRTPLGLDFTQKFCVGFAAAHGSAVCGDQAALPFVDGAFPGAYAVTSLMYLDNKAANVALAELNRCLDSGGLILLLEPCREFNELARLILPRKGREQLAMPGFSIEEFRKIIPADWSIIATGSCRWLTIALPLLAITTRWPGLHRYISMLARHLDRPSIGRRNIGGRIAMYRWVACKKEI